MMVEIWRVDGKVELREIPKYGALDTIQDLIGADTLDTVKVSATDDRVMLVDDTGLIDGRPLNQAATDLYQALGHLGFNAGDVALVHDADFE
jgi:hypothetical protein